MERKTEKKPTFHENKPSNKFAMIFLTATVFLSAFLLFVSELLIGRLLLPFWGGSIHIWLTCLMFFQAMLLLGYLYAHFLGRRIGRLHLFALLLPLINLPFSMRTEPGAGNPILSLLAVLISGFALPFVMLSTTAIMAQSWLARSSLGQRDEPYPLYAASNAGSLVALPSYALIVEPLVGIKAQSLTWTIFYMVMIVLMLISWTLLRPEKAEGRKAAEVRSKEAPEKIPGLSKYGFWLALSGLPSALLLVVSNFISMEIGSFPMIWMMPLSCYLSSFVVTFRTGGNVPKLLTVIWPEIILIASAFYFTGSDSIATLFACLLVFFMICILAHRNLYEMRPPSRWLTHFYLTTAVGGFLGSVSVSLIAPAVFKGYFEYLILLFLIGVLFWRLRDSSFRTFWREAPRSRVAVRLFLLGVILTLIGMGIVSQSKDTVPFRHRNFYGTYRIIDDLTFDPKLGGLRMIVHGKTLHGAQMLSPTIQMMPVTYYYQGGGFSDVYETTPKPRRMAVIGLGAGVICAYTDEKDTLTFYEIDPDNYEIARRWFTYLDQSRGKVNVTVGDGRLSLKNLGKDGPKYDLITIDAFTGDGIPIHLLTREAVEVYLNRLADNGILLFHISSRYYDLRSVIKSTAAVFNLQGVMNPVENQGRLEKYQKPTRCVALARERLRMQPLIDRGWVPFGERDGLSGVKPWTDDHINILIPLMEALKKGSFDLM
jgi:hypothetical protein